MPRLKYVEAQMLKNTAKLWHGSIGASVPKCLCAVKIQYSSSSPPRAGSSSHTATPHPMYHSYAATPHPMQHAHEIEDEEAPLGGGEEAHDGVHIVLILSSSQWRIHCTPPLLLMMEEAVYASPSIHPPSWAECRGI
jgi:hypothetical protein